MTPWGEGYAPCFRAFLLGGLFALSGALHSPSDDAEPSPAATALLPPWPGLGQGEEGPGGGGHDADGEVGGGVGDAVDELLESEKAAPVVPPGGAGLAAELSEEDEEDEKDGEEEENEDEEHEKPIPQTPRDSVMPPLSGPIGKDNWEKCMNDTNPKGVWCMGGESQNQPLIGMLRSTCNKLNCVTAAYHLKLVGKIECYHQKSSLDKPDTWSLCKENYFVAGIRRTPKYGDLRDQHWLNCCRSSQSAEPPKAAMMQTEAARHKGDDWVRTAQPARPPGDHKLACKDIGFAWSTVQISDDPDGTWAGCQPFGSEGAIVGLFRGTCDGINCITQVRCCNGPKKIATETWECVTYTGSQDDNWCKQGHTVNGITYKFFGEKSPCGEKCYCCRTCAGAQQNLQLPQSKPSYSTKQGPQEDRLSMTATSASIKFGMKMTVTSGWRAIRDDDLWAAPGNLHIQVYDGRLAFSVLGNQPVDQWFHKVFQSNTDYSLELIYNASDTTVRLLIGGKLESYLPYKVAVPLHITPGHIGAWQQVGQEPTRKFLGTITGFGIKSLDGAPSASEGDAPLTSAAPASAAETASGQQF